MSLNKKEIDMIISAIDLIIQWYGSTKELESLVDKLLKMKEGESFERKRI